ncbi:DEAD/DEAH box helicase [Terrihabitans sp. B22-R8]|uniref:DEAD/DEAH box helicase n=1 Tax=Terrihabitans sp. B22-R8 TaxID=3425128 RepID=UPI00403C2BD7
MTTFAELGLNPLILKALASEGYETPTPIQANAIPPLLKGRDLLGIAQTGTGKTAAFALPILHRLAADKRPPQRRSCRALILSPTRELASQIAASFRAYGRHLGFSVEVIFGGVSAGPQARALAGGIDVLVATPGRLLDHLRGGMLKLDPVEVFVLDEADQMLDMGFIRDIRRVVAALPKTRHSLFFSATMPKEIGVLASELLRDPQEVAVTPVAKTADRVEQRIAFVDAAAKRPLLVDLLKNRDMDRVLVFSRTKHGADKIARHLTDAGVDAAAIHGNKSQGARERALASFKAGKTRALVATDIAARGIDVDGVTHVVNFDLPNVPESYVHRIGRTARAGATGIAISFCAPDERSLLRDIEKLIQQRVPPLEGHEQAHAEMANATARPRQPQNPSQQNRRGRQGPGNGRNQGRDHRPASGGGGAKDQRSAAPRREQTQPSRSGDSGLANMPLMQPSRGRAHQDRRPGRSD